jgi:hypothetical protein
MFGLGSSADFESNAQCRFNWDRQGCRRIGAEFQDLSLLGNKPAAFWDSLGHDLLSSLLGAVGLFGLAASWWNLNA